jgi:hypothetical protein
MKECKTGYMLLAALFTIITLWSKTTCISTDESIKKISCTCIVENFSITKKNEIRTFAIKWMELMIIMLSEATFRRTEDNGPMIPLSIHIYRYVCLCTCCLGEGGPVCMHEKSQPGKLLSGST